MSERKETWTKGPWSYSENADGAEAFGVSQAWEVGAGDIGLALVSGCEANARLIAAAPALYEALKALADDYATISPKYHNTNVYAAARSALLLANTGGTENG